MNNLFKNEEYRGSVREVFSSAQLDNLRRYLAYNVSRLDAQYSVVSRIVFKTFYFCGAIKIIKFNVYSNTFVSNKWLEKRYKNQIQNKLKGKGKKMIHNNC